MWDVKPLAQSRVCAVVVSACAGVLQASSVRLAVDRRGTERVVHQLERAEAIEHEVDEVSFVDFDCASQR